MDEALTLIGALYRHEGIIPEQKLAGEARRQYRVAHSAPALAGFWNWHTRQLLRTDFTPKNPFAKALKYVQVRQAALRVFIADPELPIDTNHLERAIRPIPLGTRNWMFCWTELGAKQIGVLQSLLATCRLHDVDPYTYLVDVLQRVSAHPQKDIIELTTGVWKEKFAHAPMRSFVDKRASG